MAIKIKSKDTAKKIAPKVKAAEAGFDQDKVARRYKKLQAELAEIEADPKIKKKRDELDQLKKELINHGNRTLGNDETLVIVTPLGDVKIGKRGTARSITDMDKAVGFMGQETFMKVAKITMSDLDKYLNPEEIEQVIVTKVTDTRRIT